MKNLSLLLLLLMIILKSSAQNLAGGDTILKFDQKFTKCERKWVAFRRSDTVKRIYYGFIYIDEQAGFTLDLKGTFYIDISNKFIADTSLSANKALKYRLKPNWPYFGLIPSKRFAELNLLAEPAWVKIYYQNTDTLQHLYRMGYVYNDADECGIALTYLKRAYVVNPHPPGVDFELAFAYNALKQYDDAISVLLPAMLSKPGDPLYYKELGYAYSHKNDYPNAIDTYKKGIEYFKGDEPNESKGEMASNMASIYKAMGKMDDYKFWMIKAKEYTPTTSYIYKQITDAGF